MIKNPVTRGAGSPPAAGRPEARPHRHAGREPPRRAVVDPRHGQPGVAGQPGTVPPPLRQADRARRRLRERQRLRRLTQPFVLRRGKADRTLVPDLPDKIEQVAWAGLTREQTVLYQHVVDQLLLDASTTTGMKRQGLVLAALTRLKQICNHPAHALGDGSRLAGRSASSPATTSWSTSSSTSTSEHSCSPSSARWASCSASTPPSGCSCACRSSTAAFPVLAATRWSPASRRAKDPHCSSCR